jgi:hypothetical protein
MQLLNECTSKYSDFRRGVNEIFALLDVMQHELIITDVTGQTIGPIFQGQSNEAVLRLFEPVRWDRCPETSVSNCQSTLINIPKGWRSQVDLSLFNDAISSLVSQCRMWRYWCPVLTQSCHEWWFGDCQCLTLTLRWRQAVSITFLSGNQWTGDMKDPSVSLHKVMKTQTCPPSRNHNQDSHIPNFVSPTYKILNEKSQ